MQSSFKKIVIPLASLLCSLGASSQEKAGGVEKVADSLSAKAKTEIKNAGSSLAGSLTAETSQKLNTLLDSKTALSALTGKVDLFPKGKLLKFGEGHLSAEYTWLRDTTGLITGAYNDINAVYGYQAGATIYVANLPFNASVQGNNGMYSFYNTPIDNFNKFNFDHKKYIDKLKSLAQQKIKPDAILASALTRVNSIRAGYERSLKKEIEAVQASYYSQFRETIQVPDDITNLSVQDMGALKRKVLSQVNENDLASSAERYQELLKNGSGATTDSVMHSLKARTEKKAALEKIYSKIATWKSRFDGNKTVKELRSHLPFTQDNFKGYLSQPGKLQDIVNQYGNIGSIQKLFMNMTKMDLGQNALSEGNLSLESIVNSGINTNFQNKKASAGFIYGRNNNVNNWLQGGLQSFVSNEYNSLSGFKIGGGAASMSDQWIALNLFSFNNSPAGTDRSQPLQSGYITPGNRKDAVVTAHSGIPITGKHKITVDLSRSFGTYTNSLSADSLAIKTGAFGSNNQKDNYAISLAYTGEVAKTTLQLTTRKTGLGYNNPGNIFLRRGETMGGIGVTRKFFKNKLSLRYNTEYRSQAFDPEKLYKFITTTNKAGAGWRFHRNTRVNISWQQSNYTSSFPGIEQTKGINSRLQADGGYRLKLFRKWVNTNVTVAQQRTDIPTFDTTAYKSKSWLLVHTNSLAIDKNLITLTLISNISDNKDYYFNTSFYNAETNYMYAAGGKLRLGTGAGFYINSGWNHQIGIKQQMSWQLIKNLGIDIDAGYKKAIRVIREELANQFYGTASINYQF